MGWYEKEQPTPFDDTPITGLYFLDGDVLAAYVGRNWTKGQKYPLVAFPSGQERDIWESSSPLAVAIIHLFGEMDLPLKGSREEAFEQANYIGEQCGYLVNRVGENQLELVGHDIDEHLVVTYDAETGVMADVVQLKDDVAARPRPMELLTDELRERLPDLYSTEELGLEAPAQVKYFTPDSGWTWYASEFDGEDLFFGLVVGLEIELGLFSLSELQTARGPLGLPIERDKFFESQTLKELKTWHEQERRSR